MNDDYTNDSSTSGLYVLGGDPLNGSIETIGDSDWFRVEGLQKYYDYMFSVGAPGGADYPIDTNIDLRNLEGQQYRLIQYFGADSKHHKHLLSSDIFVDLSLRANGRADYEFSAVALDVGADTFEDAKRFRLQGQAFTAAAIEAIGDRDFLKFDLLAGVEYTVDLLGEASQSQRETTLVDPQLTLYKPDGSVAASDSDSSAGNNARVIYTPETSGAYVFEVASESDGVGSYVLESSQFDDHPSGINGTAVIDLLSEDSVTVDFVSNYTDDKDSFQVAFLPGANYRIRSPQAGVFTLYDEAGDEVPIAGTQVAAYRYLSGEETESLESLFLETSRYSVGEKQFTIELRDDHSAFNRDALRPLEDTRKGIIERTGDRDWFSFQPTRFGRYRFSVAGDPELLLSLAMRRDFVEIKNTGPRKMFLNESELEPNASLTNDVIIGVRSNARKLGQYVLKVDFYNAEEGENTTSIVDMSQGAGRIRNVVTNEHQSWHRIAMKANTWYQIDSPDIDFQIRSASTGATRSLVTGTQFYFSGEDSDSRFLITETDSLRKPYEIKILESAKPSLRSRHWLSPGNASSAFDTAVARSKNVEVYATRPFEYESNGETISAAPGTYHTMSGNEFYGMIGGDSNPLDFDQTVAGNTNIFFRQELSADHWSQWAVVETYDRAGVPGIGAIDQALPRSLTYAFAEDLPSYLTGDARFPNVTAFDSEERSVFDEVIDRWGRASNNLFKIVEPGDQNDAADIMIFKASLDSDVLAFPLVPGEPNGIGGDIVLNTNSPLWDDLSRGKQGRFEMLRAIGVALGLEETESVGRNESVMGFRSGPDFDALPFPSSPMPADSFPFFEAFRLTTHRPETGVVSYELGGDAPFYETIYDGFLYPDLRPPTTRVRVSASQSPLDATIDLRPGGANFVTDGDNQPYTWVLSEFSIVPDAHGGNGNDTINGNAMENTLVGAGGDDVLIGGVGDDLLLGQAGDDYYSYTIGHGSDTISEQGFGGMETLRIEGLKNFDSLAEDVSFRRLGNGLRIRLDLDGVTDKNASVIRLHNIGEEGFEIESLVMIREAQFLNRVSLMSVFEQADNTWRRFELASGSDSNGSLVTPVG